MKLRLGLLERFVELPTREPRALRELFDDLIGEVKNIEGEGEATVFTIETLANRGDHLYALGVAREVAARNLTQVTPPAVAELPTKKAAISVRKTTDLCKRYALLEMNLPPNMTLRSDVAKVLGEDAKADRNAIVQLLAYVQSEVGQPMHAFDRDSVEGEVVVSLTEREEQIEALDGRSYRVPKGSIVICDKKKIIAVAGVIGCANSMVKPETTRVLIESACFDPVSVRKTARAMGVNTDASFAFERGTDIELVLNALRRLVFLAKGVSGSGDDTTQAHPLGITVLEGQATEKRRIALSLTRLREQMNLPRLADIEVPSRFKHLGFAVEALVQGKETVFQVTVPSWRLWDVVSEEDLIEEFVRAYGLNRVKFDPPQLSYDQPEPEVHEVFLETCESVFVGSGFNEVVTRSYYDNESAALLEELSPSLVGKHIKIQNSLDGGYSNLKTSNVLHLTRLVQENLKRGVTSAKIFEVARVFGVQPEGSLYEYERDVCSFACGGRWFDHEWKAGESRSDLMSHFRGLAERLVQAFGLPFSVAEGESALFHPGLRGTIKAGRRIVGEFGLVHPLIVERLGYGNAVVVYGEVNPEQLVALRKQVLARAVIDFPKVRRDLTVKISLDAPAGKVVRWIEEMSLPHLKNARIVDEFRKEAEQFRRVSYRFTFQSPARTLESAEIDLSVQAILGMLKEKGIELAG